MRTRRTPALVAAIMATAFLVSCETILGAPNIVVTPTSLDLGAWPTGMSIAQSVTVENRGSAGTTVEASASASWLSLSTDSFDLPAGTSESVIIGGTCTAAMEGTTTEGTVAFASASQTLEVTVQMTCFADSDLIAQPAQAFLSGEEGDTPAMTLDLFNTTGDAVDFTIENVPAWLGVDPVSGTIPANGSVTLSLALVDACPIGRSVQASAFVVATAQVDLAVDAYQVCAEAPAHDYNVDIRFFGDGFDVPTIEDFLDAAAKWESVISGDLQSHTITSKAEGSCSGAGFPDEPALLDETIDDLLVHAGVSSIDGPFNVVGSAGPCIVRSSTSADAYLPVYGTAFFDADDVERLRNENRFAAVVLHEMGHVIGIGTLWDNPPFDLIAYEPSDLDCRLTASFNSGPSYVGAEGVAAYGALTGASEASVPLEEEGGSGTKCGHWDEGVFGDELMTGYLDGASDPLSAVTGHSLRDLGYETDAAGYEPYALPDCSPTCTAAIDTQEHHIEEIVVLPRYVLRPDGSLAPLEGSSD